jgi:hypothetical protein
MLKYILFIFILQLVFRVSDIPWFLGQCAESCYDVESLCFVGGQYSVRRSIVRLPWMAGGYCVASIHQSESRHGYSRYRQCQAKVNE